MCRKGGLPTSWFIGRAGPTRRSPSDRIIDSQARPDGAWRERRFGGELVERLSHNGGVVEPGSQASLRRRIRIVLLLGLSALLGVFVLAAAYATLAINQLRRREVSDINGYLQRSEQLRRLRQHLTAATDSVRDFHMDPDEATRAGHRLRAFESWEMAIDAMRQYNETAPERKELTGRLQSGLTAYWATAEASLKSARSRSHPERVGFYLGQLDPIRQRVRATMNELDSVDRADAKSDAEDASSAAHDAANRLWAVVGLACLLWFAVATITFLYVMRLEHMAAEQHTIAIQTAQELRRLSERVLTSQEDERKRIARELHDDYGQRLVAMIYEISGLTGRTELNPLASEVLASLSERLSQLAADLQQLTRGLHSAVLEKIGLEAAIRAECENLSRRETLHVTFSSEAVPRRLPGNIALAIYRVFQEAASNTIRHSRSGQMDVALRMERDDLVLRVLDFGCGFQAESSGESGGLGLISMRERLRTVGGTLAIRTRPGSGAGVEARIPLASAG